MHPLAELLEYMTEGDPGDPIVQLVDMAPNKKQELLDILPCQLHPIVRGYLAQQQENAAPQQQPGTSRQQQQDAMQGSTGKGCSAAANSPAAPLRQPGSSTSFGAAGSMHTACTAAMPPSFRGAAGKPAVAGSLTGQSTRVAGPQLQGSAVKKPPAMRPPSASKASGMRLNTQASSKAVKPDARGSPTRTGCSTLDSESCLEPGAEGQQVSDSSAPEGSCLVGGVTGSSFTALPGQLDAGGRQVLAAANARRAEGRGSNDGAADSANTGIFEAEGGTIAITAAAAAEPDAHAAADAVEARAPFIRSQMSSTEAGARFAVALAELERLQFENERLQQQQAEFIREQGHREEAVQLREQAVQEREQALQLREQKMQQQEQAVAQ